MTFVVNESGTIYEKDLGPNTTKLAESHDCPMTRIHMEKGGLTTQCVRLRAGLAATVRDNQKQWLHALPWDDAHASQRKATWADETPDQANSPFDRDPTSHVPLPSAGPRSKLQCRTIAADSELLPRFATEIKTTRKWTTVQGHRIRRPRPQKQRR